MRNLEAVFSTFVVVIMLSFELDNNNFDGSFPFTLPLLLLHLHMFTRCLENISHWSLQSCSSRLKASCPCLWVLVWLEPSFFHYIHSYFYRELVFGSRPYKMLHELHEGSENMRGGSNHFPFWSHLFQWTYIDEPCVVWHNSESLKRYLQKHVVVQPLRIKSGIWPM